MRLYILSRTLITAMLLSMLPSHQAYADVRSWVDVTDKYIVNPRYENNNGTGWSGTTLGFDHPRQNAQHYNKAFNSFQNLTGLKPGKYRLSVQGFYRAGNASKDYEYCSSYKSTFRYASLYGTSSTSTYSSPLPFCSSAKQTNSLGGGVSEVTEGGDWWGGGTKYYFPQNMEAAHYWFEAGYYTTTVQNIEVGDDGKLTIGIKKTKTIAEDWTCFTNWKLEYYDVVGIATKGSVLINEIMPANLDEFIDPSWNYGGFVEFYNPTDETVAVGSCYISDDPANLKKHAISSSVGIIPAHGFCTLWFDNYGRYGLTQIKFKLDIDGGTLYLSDPEGNVILEQDYPEAVRRCSYSRTTDGGEEWSWNGSPSPGSTNNRGSFSMTQLDAPTVNKPGRVFSGSLAITVRIPLGTTLRYTTDGSTPTMTNGSTNKSGSFTINETTVFRFRLFRDGYLPSDVTTCSYIKNDKDFCVPIISIVTDDKNIYGDDYGIFVKGNGNGKPGNGQDDKCNWNMDWDRPVSFEYIPDGKEVCLAQEVNMCAVGGWSRAWSPHSFKLKANKEYGLKYMPYAFFTDKPYNKNKTLQIRNGGNDNICRIKDAALQELVRRGNIDIDCQSYQPVFVYINGRMYDVLNMREPNNKHFAYANRGLDDDQQDQFEYNPDEGFVLQEGTRDAFNRWMSLARNAADTETYEKIKEIVDIDEFVNYMAVEMYLCSNDWLDYCNNVKAYRPLDGKFRFVLFDLDAAFNNNNEFTAVESHPSKPLMSDLELTTAWLNMLENGEFRKKFIDAFCVVAGSLFEPTRCKTIIQELSDEANKAMSQVGGSSSNTAKSLVTKLSKARQTGQINILKGYSRMKLQNVTQVTATITSNVDDARIFINEMLIPTEQFSGLLFLPVTLHAEVPAGYRFTGWSNGSSIVSTENEYELTKSATQTLTALFEAIPEEERLLAGIVPVRINEVSAANTMFANDYFDREDWIELYNTTDKTIDLKGMYISDDIDDPRKYKIDGGSASTMIEPHGFRIIWCDKNEPRTQLHAPFKLSNSDGSFVVLTAEDGSWADTILYDVQTEEQTFGRYPDGANDIYLMNLATAASHNRFTSYDLFRYGSIDEATGIAPTIAERGYDKSNAAIYNLTGQPVGEDYRGVIIRNGKKYLIK
ncbi:MAG: CotH kinase family protein [Bacteroidaceae bacterium]|nr:CotH kinase family protein [Bacteroidaceae bacterium]